MLQLWRNFLFSPSVFAKSQICQLFLLLLEKGFNTLLSTLQTTLANKLEKNGAQFFRLTESYIGS